MGLEEVLAATARDTPTGLSPGAPAGVSPHLGPRDPTGRVCCARQVSIRDAGGCSQTVLGPCQSSLAGHPEDLGFATAGAPAAAAATYKAHSALFWGWTVGVGRSGRERSVKKLAS